MSEANLGVQIGVHFVIVGIYWYGSSNAIRGIVHGYQALYF